MRSVKGFLITEEHLIFLVGSDEQEIDLSPEEISLLIERKNVPVGLFMAYLGELSNLKPAYNWFLKTVKNKRFEEIFTIIRNFPRLSDGSPPPTTLNTFRRCHPAGRIHTQLSGPSTAPRVEVRVAGKLQGDGP